MYPVVPNEDKRAKALELILTTDMPITEIAKQVGVTRQTIHNWKKSHEFVKAINKQEELILDNLYSVALNKLDNLLMSSNPYNQQFAISTIMKIKGKNDVNIKVEQSKPMTLDDLLRDMDN